MFKIGNVNIDDILILAPLAGVSNMAFRQICKSHGANLVYTEMISDKGLIYKNKKTFDMLKISPMEHPISLQLFGSDKDTLKEALELIKDVDFDILDINMGCPVNKVVKSGSGSALLKDPNKIYEIIKTLKATTNKPVSIKIRLGWDMDSINFEEVVLLADKAGVDCVCIHTRTRSMLYKGLGEPSYIKRLKGKVKCKIIGNGDIKTKEDVLRYLDAGCDAVMIGRAALGNPWIFEKLKCELQNIPYIEPTIKEVIDTVLLHARKLQEISSEKQAIVEMRTHAAWYFKKLPNSKEYRKQLVTISSIKELEDICNDYLKKASQNI